MQKYPGDISRVLSCNTLIVKSFHSTATLRKIPLSGKVLLGMTLRDGAPYIGKVFSRSQAAISAGRRGERVRYTCSL